MRQQRAFSLVELIIVITILAVLSVIMLPMLQSGFNSYFTQRNLTDANWQGRLALARIARDLRSLPSSNNISTANSTQLTFINSANTSVSYTLNGTSLQRNGLTLANGVSALTFGYYDSTGAVTALLANIGYISITLNITQNNTNSTVTTTVDLRNITS